MKIGVLPGKFYPPHLGHLYTIFKAAGQVDTLIVVVSTNPTLEQQLCTEKMPNPIPVNARTKWLKQVLQELSFIKVVVLDETNIPMYPNGWKEWSSELNKLVQPFKEENDSLVIFGSEPDYTEGYAKYFPNAEYKLIDVERKMFPISSTLIRENPLHYWDYLIGPSREYFCKKVLITGTESTGKSSLTIQLSKLFLTSCSDEVGRNYAKRFLGGDETIFEERDFARIAMEQHLQDARELTKANKVCFFDTDAIVTSFFGELYLDNKFDVVEDLIELEDYDLVLVLAPTVPWVADGQRMYSNQSLRENLYHRLLHKYLEHPVLRTKIEFIDSPSFAKRLDKALEAVRKLF